MNLVGHCVGKYQCKTGLQFDWLGFNSIATNKNIFYVQ